MTVDLLTTGVDIPKVDKLVFIRRVRSRILFEQMLGRATRPCPEIGKETFRIYDAVGLYAALATEAFEQLTGRSPADCINDVIRASDFDQLVSTFTRLPELAALIERLSLEQRRVLAETLTDAVLVPEVGQFAPAARVGFQVHFVGREPDMMAIGGRLLVDAGPEADVMLIDVTVMDRDWRQEVRTEVIERVLAAMADACGLAEPSPAWWVNVRVIDEGSWGSRGGVLSILSLLDTGVFTEEKATAVSAHLGV